MQGDGGFRAGTSTQCRFDFHILRLGRGRLVQKLTSHGDHAFQRGIGQRPANPWRAPNATARIDRGAEPPLLPGNDVARGALGHFAD